LNSIRADLEPLPVLNFSPFQYLFFIGSQPVAWLQSLAAGGFQRFLRTLNCIKKFSRNQKASIFVFHIKISIK